jgi:hypothetical protein
MIEPQWPLRRYLPRLLEALDLAELTHDARNNRMRALALTRETG